jgi:hypothetical protein
MQQSKMTRLKKSRAVGIQQLPVACCRSVHYCSPFDLPYRNCEVKYPTAVILPVVLQGCTTWSVTLRGVRALWVLENRVLNRILGPKRDEVKSGLEEAL